VKHYVFERDALAFKAKTVTDARRMIRSRNWGMTWTGVPRHLYIITVEREGDDQLAQDFATVCAKAGVTTTAHWNRDRYSTGEWFSTDGLYWTDAKGAPLNCVQAARCRAACILLIGGRLHKTVLARPRVD
jgi:hypothetical protein